MSHPIIFFRKTDQCFDSKRLRLRRASPREDWGLGFVSPGLPITSLVRAEAALLGINQWVRIMIARSLSPARLLSLVLFPEIEFKRLGRLTPFPFEGRRSNFKGQNPRPRV
ncbi:predicted protein [Coccidioides posadasii str. Silveira]|uniref:Predicted protein n=2 Tax=Coccidioides posadasii TaxID=199306 RepID=E9D9C0_COCPS|nr:predicted protein [Coccidioides posadasii str. Silveira]KMM70066.1 hypothetical protein CPAG_06378 [Coccidioides posadasii RMSCC 3488]